MLTVVGIGADGWSGLSDEARRILARAPMIVGSPRQLDLLTAEVGGTRRAWPSPLQSLVDELAAGLHGPAAVLASGDPTLHGIGTTLIRAAGPAHVRVVPHPSAFALACARMGWPQDEVTLVSAVVESPEVVIRSLQPGRRIVVFVTGTDGAARLARVICDHGAPASAFTILEQLGGPGESRVDCSAEDAATRVAGPLHLAAVEVVGGPAHSLAPGRPDDAYASDGQLTKRHVRAITLAALGPLPGDLLWDVGAGSGSVAVEWCRVEPAARAIAIEDRAERARRIGENAHALGVPALRVVSGRAPDALLDLPRPTAIFVGGGVTTPGVLGACWSALYPGGRLVANTVTLEGEQTVFEARRSLGGDLLRIDLASAEPVGDFTGWRTRMTVVQWTVAKPA
jgi:precorrin-6Y C5,15-methyltransferase (decarboxylating)